MVIKYYFTANHLPLVRIGTNCSTRQLLLYETDIRKLVPTRVISDLRTIETDHLITGWLLVPPHEIVHVLGSVNLTVLSSGGPTHYDRPHEVLTFLHSKTRRRSPGRSDQPPFRPCTSWGNVSLDSCLRRNYPPSLVISKVVSSPELDTELLSTDHHTSVVNVPGIDHVRDTSSEISLST